MKTFVTALLLGISLPYVTSAQNNVRNLKDLVEVLVGYFNVAILIIASLAVIVFVWNIFKYFIYDTDSANKAEAGKYLMYSLIGFFVMLSLWGLVSIVRETFILDNSSPGPVPFGGSVGARNVRINPSKNSLFDSSYNKDVEEEY